jgi:hypothetical protein
LFEGIGNFLAGLFIVLGFGEPLETLIALLPLVAPVVAVVFLLDCRFDAISPWAVEDEVLGAVLALIPLGFVAVFRDYAFAFIIHDKAFYALAIVLFFLLVLVAAVNVGRR